MGSSKAKEGRGEKPRRSLLGRLRRGGGDEPVSFEQVLGTELSDLRQRRDRLRGRRLEGEPDGETRDIVVESGVRKTAGVYASAHYDQLRGLAFSGGGIRSATFNLGVLQALAHLRLLRWFDYLSTVSGGGYIGSWLAGWIRRASLEEVEAELVREHPEIRKSDSAPDAAGRSPITFLRQYSNYLTPRRGFFSLDTWTAVATYVRNLILNLSIVTLAMAFVLLLPRSVVFFAWLAGDSDNILPIVLLLLLSGLAVSAYNAERQTSGPVRALTRPKPIFWAAVLPFFLAGTLAAIWLPQTNQALPERPVQWMLVCGFLYLAFWLAAGLIALFLPGANRAQLGKRWILVVFWAFFAGCGGGAALRFFADYLWRMVNQSGVGWTPVVSAGVPALALNAISSAAREVGWIPVVTFGPPGVVGIFVLTAVIHIGLIGRAFEERNRQWWSRLGAWLTILSLGWLALFCVTFYGPPLMVKLNRFSWGLTAGWIVLTAAGIWAGRSAATEGGSENRWMGLVARIAPYVFIAGLVSVLTLGVHRGYPQAVRSLDRWLEEAGQKRPHVDLVPASPSDSLADIRRDELRITVQSLRGHFLEYVILSGALLAALLALSWRVDINQFSMHLFYRNRLIRPYLGASRARKRARRPDLFTGFDPGDDLPLAHLRVDQKSKRRKGESKKPYDGPYPILTTTVNLTAGQELASQDRAASSFVFTPRFYGFAPSITEAQSGRPDGRGEVRDPRSLRAYRETRAANNDRGMSLGAAMGISGAAVSPGMGQHRSRALAILLTIFNARLGWWMGNPRHPRTWHRAGPTFGLWTMLDELLGKTHADAPYVSLSDGGFFDNLGLYELVRRRCRFILVTDVEEDPELEFNGLGTTIRRCRADFGVDIDIDVDPIRQRDAEGFSQWHCAVGTIHYDRVDERAPRGTLVYLKATLTGDEPPDLLSYARESDDFPHESTSDQFFGESQFESYRALGYHSVMKLFEAIGMKPREKDQAEEPINMEQVFVRLRQTWYPPSAASEGSFTRHTQQLDRLFERIRTDRRLAFLDRQIYRELEERWRELDDASELRVMRGRELTPEEFRAGFYLCNSLIQLMESVYLDLDLEGEAGHPDNRGWFNLFRQWARSPMFRQTWAVCSSTFGTRFQKFGERSLGLDRSFRVGDVDVSDEMERAADGSRAARSLLAAAEWELVRKFRGDPETAPQVAKLLALRVEVPEEEIEEDEDEGATERLFGFTFGLVILDSDNRIFFMRVRRHLRRRGLARRGLFHIMRDLGVEKREMPTAEQLERLQIYGSREVFDNLFRSVRNEIHPR